MRVGQGDRPVLQGWAGEARKNRGQTAISQKARNGVSPPEREMESVPWEAQYTGGEVGGLRLMEVIEVDGLPPEVVRGLRDLVHALKGRLEPRPAPELPEWPGDVIASMSRDDLYRDAG